MLAKPVPAVWVAAAALTLLGASCGGARGGHGDRDYEREREDRAAADAEQAEERPWTASTGSESPPVPLYWNPWVEEGPQPKGLPLESVKPGASVLLTVDLSGVRYGDALPGGRPVGSSFAELLAQPGLPAQVDFGATLIPDGEYFETASTGGLVEGVLPVDMARLRSHVEDPGVLASRHLGSISVREAVGDGVSPFTFGRMTFRLDVKDGVSGLATASILVWHRNAVMDQVDVGVCVAPEPELPFECFRDVPIRPPQLGRGLPEYERALTIYLAQFPNRPKVFGVARAARSGRLVTWRLDDSLQQLRESLDRQLARIRGETSDPRLADAGWRLFATLFPPDPDGSSAITPLLRDELRAPPAAFSPGAPVISVRVVDQSGDPLLIPLGLMHDRKDFLGRRYRIEAPMGSDAVRLQPCPTQWVLIRPHSTTADGAIVEARRRTADVFDGWSRAGAASYDGPSQWRRILAGTSHESSAIVVLSHHDTDRLIFPAPSGDEELYPDDIVARFARPSLVLLNGCGTARPGASEFVRKLHNRGVDVVVATAAEVSAELAGDYIRCFAAALDKSGTASVRDLHWAALGCVDREGRAQGGVSHGANVLKYVVLGNGGMSACAPGRTP